MQELIQLVPITTIDFCRNAKYDLDKLNGELVEGREAQSFDLQDITDILLDTNKEIQQISGYLSSYDAITNRPIAEELAHSYDINKAEIKRLDFPELFDLTDDTSKYKHAGVFLNRLCVFFNTLIGYDSHIKYALARIAELNQTRGTIIENLLNRAIILTREAISKIYQRCDDGIQKLIKRHFLKNTKLNFINLKAPTTKEEEDPSGYLGFYSYLGLVDSDEFCVEINMGPNQETTGYH